MENTRAGYSQGRKDRFSTENAESYSEEQMLELLLTFAIESEDVKPIAEAIECRQNMLAHLAVFVWDMPGNGGMTEDPPPELMDAEEESLG